VDCHAERSEAAHKVNEGILCLHDDEPKPGRSLHRNNQSLMRRVWQHQNSEIEGFTKTYKVNRLVYYECFSDPRDAIAREKEIKGWRREKKNALVETKNPRWTDLSPMLFQHFKPSSRASATTGDDNDRR
jgi:putative endonuclease